MRALESKAKAEIRDLICDILDSIPHEEDEIEFLHEKSQFLKSGI